MGAETALRFEALILEVHQSARGISYEEQDVNSEERSVNSLRWRQCAPVRSDVLQRLSQAEGCRRAARTHYFNYFNYFHYYSLGVT